MVCSIGKPYSLLRDYAEKKLQTQDKDIGNSYWFGSGAQKLNLNNHVLPKEYQNLYLGFDKLGKPLKQRQMNKGHRAGRDLTFSAPKSVSIAYLVEGKKELLKAHTQAVKETLGYIEKNCIFTRLGKGGCYKEQTNNMVVAVFQHSRSRNYDPNLHSHCVIFNCTQGRDSKWRSMDNRQLYAQKMTLGMIYRHHLAQRLQQIGYSLTWNRDGTFDLTNYSREQIAQFSSRRAEIINFAGINSSTKERAKACIATRNVKQYLNVDKQKEIESAWKSKLHSVNFSPIKHNEFHPGLVAENVPFSELSIASSSNKARLEFFQNRINTLITDAIALINSRDTNTRFSEHELLRETLVQAKGNYDIKQVSQAIESHPELIPTEEGKLTTAKLIRQEKSRQQTSLSQPTIADKVKAIFTTQHQPKAIALSDSNELEFQAVSESQKRIDATIDRYLAEDSLHKPTVVVNTEEDKTKLLSQTRKKLIQKGKLTNKSIVTTALYPKQLSKEEKLNPQNYQPGNAIKFTRDSKKVRSDRIYKIIEVDAKNKMLVLTDRYHNVVSLPINRYQNRQLFEVERRELRTNEVLRFSCNQYIKGHQVRAGQLCTVGEIKSPSHIKVKVNEKQIIVNADNLFFTEYGYAITIDDYKNYSGRINRCIYCPDSNVSKELFKQNLIEVASLTKENLSVYFENNNFLSQILSTSNKEKLKMDDITRDDHLFEIASSAKYLVTTDIQDSQGKVLDIDRFTTIERSNEGLTIRHDDKELKFDNNLKVEKNELSDKQVKDLSQKIKKDKERTIQENRTKEINRNIGLSL